jgi:type II secretory pathway pseudopilin PulG
MNKLKNKGFSMVEIILIIAIMAILGSALAVRIIKYVTESRISVDKQTCSTIKTCVNVEMGEDYNHVTVNPDGTKTSGSVWDRVAKKGTEFCFYVRRSDDGKDIIIAGLKHGHPAADEIKKTLHNMENPKQAGMNSYEVLITAGHTNMKDEATGKISKVFTIKKIKVGTSEYNFNADKDDI